MAQVALCLDQAQLPTFVNVPNPDGGRLFFQEIARSQNRRSGRASSLFSPAQRALAGGRGLRQSR
jgi:hypothetical protein